MNLVRRQRGTTKPLARASRGETIVATGGRFAQHVIAVAVLLCTMPILRGDEILGPLRQVVVLPDAPELVRGFTMEVSVGRQTIAGYVPAKITVKSTGRFTAERRFVVRFQTEPELETPRQNGLRIDVPVTVSQGAASETFIRYLPKWSAGQAVSVVLTEAGRPIDGYEAFLGGENVAPVGRRRYGSAARAHRELLTAERELNWLFISGDDLANPDSLPDLRDVLYRRSLAAPVNVDTEDDEARRSFWRQAMGGRSLHAVGQKQLPFDWRAYQRYDVVLLDADGMSRLIEQKEALQSLQGWVLNGGTVVVYNAPSAEKVLEDFGFTWCDGAEQVKAVENAAFEMQSTWRNMQTATESMIGTYQQNIRGLEGLIAELRDDADNSAPDRASAASSTSEADSFEVDSNLPLLQLEQLEDQRQELDNAKASLAALDRQLAYDSKRWSEQIRVQGVGAGYLVAIKPVKDRETPLSAHWSILESFLDHRASPTLRRGVDPLIGDRRFSRWMIPGVAQPPVYTFMGLLTVFVVLVGPIAYRRTAKYGRGYLMFAIAPALALLTTLAMFGYGIFSDGFGTTARVRQLTWVDGRSGHAGERVRSTYFAGVRPSEGMRFAGNAEVMLYREGTGQSWEDLDRLSTGYLGTVNVDADSQDLDATFLPSRQQRQFITHAPRPDVGYLQLIPDPKGINPPEVSSGFEFALREAIIRDDEARYWAIENLRGGEVQATRPLTTRDASKLLGRLYNDYRPLSEVRERRSSRQRYDNEIYDIVVDINRSLETRFAINEGLFEFWLQRNMQTNGEIPNEHFVAIADVSPDVIAVEGTEISSSIRYVFGTLR